MLKISENLVCDSTESTPQKINYILPQDYPSFNKNAIYIEKWRAYLSPNQYSVLTYLASKVHRTKGYAYPAVKTGAWDCNITEKTFIKCVSVLEELGLIFVDRQFVSNRYYFMPVIEPNLELLERCLPKAVSKFKKKESIAQDETKQYILEFAKVMPFTKNTKGSSDCDPTVKSEGATVKKKASDVKNTVVSLENLQTNSNSVNSNLNQHQQTEIQKNFENDVVVEKLVSFGITKMKSIKIAPLLNPDIELDDFVRYSLKTAFKGRKMSNKAGWLIYAIQNLQDEYLEWKKEKDAQLELQSQKKEIEQELNQEDDKLDQLVQEKWQSMSENDKEQIKAKVKSNPEYRGFNFMEATWETFYLEYVRENLLKQ